MTVTGDFEPVTEVVTDERSRVGIGQAGASKNARYAVSRSQDGSILLTPMASIPARELAVWESAELRASLFRGLAEAAENDVRALPGLLDDVDPDADENDEPDE